MKVIAFNNPDGTLGICVPAPGARLVQLGNPVDRVVKFWELRGEYNVSDISELPTELNAAWAETEEAFIGRIAAKDVPSNSGAQMVDSSDLPPNRVFRNAWSKNQSGVFVDMPKARELHREKLRKLRKPVLEMWDREYLKADETGDTNRKAAVAQIKERLRNCTNDPRIDSAQTPDVLMSIIPEELK